MKKLIKQKEKTGGADKKNTRSNSKKNAGYKEEVFDAEQQTSYKKSEFNKNEAKNTSGPK